MSTLKVPQITTLMLALVIGAHGQAPAQLAPLNVDDVLLLQAYLRTKPVGEGLMAFPYGKTELLPLGELCRLLSLAIEVDVAKGQARGYFITPRRTFSLDLATCSVSVEGKRHTFAPEQVRPYAQDLYVDAALLEAWFPLKIVLHRRDSSLYITSNEPLPIEQAWARDKANARLLIKSGGTGGIMGPEYTFPYQAFSFPIADASLAWHTAGKGGSSSPQGALNLGGDLLWMSSQIFLTRDDQGSFGSSWATLFRDDPDGTLLGPMHARHIGLGDLRSNMSLPLGGGLPEGRGAAIDNYPQAFRSAFATRVFRGRLPAGWSVELFQNGSLVAYQQARPDETYELPPVSLSFGLNNFKLILHGPTGERREETIRLDIAQDMPEPGAFHYRLAALRPTLRNLNTTSAIQLLARPVLFAEGEVGLSRMFAVQTGLTRLQYSDGARTYASGGLRTVLPWASLDLLGAVSKFTPEEGAAGPDGLAAQATLRTGLGYSNLSATHSEYRRGFIPISEVTTDRKTPLLRQDQLSVSTAATLGRLPMNLTYGFQRQGYGDGQRDSQRLTVGTNFGRVNVSQTLGFDLDTQGGNSIRSQEAQLVATSFIGSYSLQGEFAGRKAQGPFRAESWGLTMGRSWESGLSLRAMVRGALQGARDPSFSATLMQQRGRLGYSLDAGYSKGGGATVGFRVQVSFGMESRSRKWFSSAQPLSSMGAVSVRAFLDDNHNGKLDPGERTLEDAKFRIGDSSQPERRLSSSVVLYAPIGAGRDLPLSLDTSSLEDPGYFAGVPYYTIRPRSGMIMAVDYPVVVQGEVMGTCQVRRGKRLEDMPGLLVELVDAMGKVVLAQRSAYDGFFEFRNLPLGKYTLRVPQAEVERLNLKHQPIRLLDLTTRNSSAEGQNLVVEFIQQIPEAETPSPKPPEPDPMLAPQIHVFPPLNSKQIGFPGNMSLLPWIEPIFPNPVNISRMPAPIDTDHPPPPSRDAVPMARSRRIRRTCRSTPIRELPRPKAVHIAEARKIRRAATALTFQAFLPWGAPSPNSGWRRLSSRRDPIPAFNLSQPRVIRQKALPDAWTIHLLTARNKVTVELVRRRLETFGKDLIVCKAPKGDPMRLLLGRYAGRDAAEAVLERLPNAFLFSGSPPSVVPFPDDGVV